MAGEVLLLNDCSFFRHFSGGPSAGRVALLLIGVHATISFGEKLLGISTIIGIHGASYAE